MMQAGQICLIRFPRTDLAVGNLRPVLVLSQLPGPYDDWLICMISSQLRQRIEELDEVIDENSPLFKESGLKVSSVIRASRLAVVDGAMLLGAIGALPEEHVKQIKLRIAGWLSN